jgi:hypothetical protein
MNEVFDMVEIAYCQGYAAGREDERQRLMRFLAERVDEIDAVWKPIRRKSYEEKVAERIAVFDQAAKRIAKDLASKAGSSMEWPAVVKPGASSCVPSMSGVACVRGPEELAPPPRGTPWQR